MTVTLVGTAAAVILGVSGAIAVGAPDDGGTDTSGGTTVGVTSGSDGEPTPVPTETPVPSPGGTDGGGTVGGSGSTGGGEPTEYPDPSDYPSPSGSGAPSPAPPADLAELTERIGELEAKVDQLPTKQELADALRAFADQLDNGGQGEG
ncbi:hypothetical protein ACFT7S_11650 [Streptomyces sp. NPDC057136]|uniref:hypothetical protein n=1 Tax=Streptomyces sp. NPDC057136 TaxID=3346029 RepID=UPI00362613F3